MSKKIDDMTLEEIAALTEEVDSENMPTDVQESIKGVDELNSEKPVETEESTPDYEAMFNSTQEQLNAMSEQLAELKKEPEPEPEPIATPEELYQQAVEEAQLTTEAQDKYDELAEYDEDGAEQFKQLSQQQEVLKAILAKKQEQEISGKKYQEEVERENQANIDAQFQEAINNSANMKGWQQNEAVWNNVNAMWSHHLASDKEYRNLSPSEQIKKLEQRYAKVAGVTSDFAESAKTEITEPPDKMPSSLSSVPGGDPASNNTHVKMDNSTDGVEIQLLVDAAVASDDPTALDRLLSSIELSG